MTTTPEGRRFLVWMIVFTILTVLSMAGRFWAAFLQRRRFRLDDALIVFAFLNLLALEIPTFIVYNHNLGAPAAELSPSEAILSLKVLYSASITWTLATCTCKVAVLWMYLHIFSSSRTMKWAVYILIGFEVAFVVAFIPIFLTICNPPNAFWNLDPMVQATKCHPIQTQQYASVAANMLLDLAVVILPMPAVWKLKLPTWKKFFVTLMFSLGTAIVGIMAWRIYHTWQTSHNPDWSATIVTTALQSHLELWLGIMAANLPMMGHLFKRAAAPVTTLYSRVSTRFTRNTQHSSIKIDSGHSKFSGNSRRTFGHSLHSQESMEIPLGRVETHAHADDVEAKAGAVFQQHHAQQEVSQIPGAVWRSYEVRVDYDDRDESQHGRPAAGWQ